jgi:hypothetical protein
VAIGNLMGYFGKRELAAWAILAAVFVALIAFNVSVWVFIAAAAVFIGYVSWSTSAFFVTQGDMRGRALTAVALPVCLAVLKAAGCFGVAWLVYWLGRHLFRS